MPSTFTPYLVLEMPAQGDQTNLWGNTVNANMGKLDTSAKANHDGLAPIPGMQSQIAALQTSDGTQTTNISTLQGQVSTLQGQVATLNSQVATLQSQIGALNAVPGQITDLYSKVAANTASINTINNTSIPNLQGQIGSIQNQVNAIPAPVDITIAEQDLNSGTMVGHWVTVHFDNHHGTVCTLGFGAGTGQQGDAIALPSGMANYAWQPYMQTIAAEAVANPLEYFHVDRPAGGSLTIQDARGATSSASFDRGVVTAGWFGTAYKRS